MRSLSRSVLALVLCAAPVSCVSYSSIQKTDKEVYLSGATNFVIIQVPFLKRCDVDGQILRCEELKEFEPSARRERGESAPASTGATAPTGPAPTVEHTSAPPAKR